MQTLIGTSLLDNPLADAAKQSGTSGTGGFMGGQRERPEEQDMFPALEDGPLGTSAKKIIKRMPLDEAVPFMPFSLGVDVVTDVKPVITDPTKLRTQPTDRSGRGPGISITDVMNFDKPQVVSNFESLYGVKNNEGQQLVFMPEMTFRERIDAADRFGATHLLQEVGVDEETNTINTKEIEIPYDNYIFDATRIRDPEKEIILETLTGEPKLEGTTIIPETNVQRILAKNMTEDELEMYREAVMLTGSLNLIDPEVGKPLFLDMLNNRLIRMGVENSRTRADIIMYARNSPGMGDVEKMATQIGENAIKFPFQMGLWAVGELADIADDLLYVDGMGSDRKKALLELNEDAGVLDIRQSSRRQAIMDTIWEPYAHRLVSVMAQRGTDISLPVAEEYISVMTGLAPRLAKLAGEILIPTRIGAALDIGLKGRIIPLQLYSSKKELLRFEDFANEQIARGTKLDFDGLLNEYIAIRSESFSPLLSRLQAMRVGNKLTKGIDMRDAALAIPEERSMVMKAIDRRDKLTSRKAALVNGIQNRGTPATSAEVNKIDAFDADINAAIRDISKAINKSSSPKFLREAQVVDGYMIIGGGTAGHIFQQNDQSFGLTSDPALGELTGIGGGLILALMVGNTPAAYAAFQKSELGRRFTSAKSHAKFLANNIGNYSPEVQSGIFASIDDLYETYEVLISRGLEESLIARGFSSMGNLIALKAMEDMARTKISVKQISNFNTEELENTLKTQQELLGRLRGILQAMPSGLGDETATPGGDFFKLVQRSIEMGEESVDRLSRDIGIINKNGVQFYLDLMDGNTKKYGAASGEESIISYNESMERLQEQNLINAADVPKTEFDRVARETQEITNENITKNADTVRSRLASNSQARRATGEALQPKQKILQKSDIATFDNPGDMLAAVAENTHAADKVIAKRGYAVLDNAKFLDADDNPIEGVVSVDVGDLFDAMFPTAEGMPTKRIRDLRSANLPSGDLAKLEQTFIDLSYPFFSAIADGTGKSVKEAVDEMAASLSKDNTFVKGISTQAQVVQILRNKAQESGEILDVFDMSFSELRELDKSLTNALYTARRAGNAAREAELIQVLGILNRKFDEFGVVQPDGSRTPVGTLRIRTKNEAGESVIRSVEEVLDEANADWASYKARWYDMNENATMPRWMWHKDKKTTPVSQANPLGIRYGGAPPREWINLSELSSMDPAKGRTWFDSLQRTLGKQIGNDFAFVEGDGTTKAVQAIFKTAVADWIIGMGGNLNPKELDDQLKALNKIFVMETGANRQVVPMLDLEGVVDDTIGWSRKTVGNEVYDRATKRALSDIKTQLDTMLEPAEKSLRLQKAAIKLLENFTGERLNQKDIANALVNGGALQLQKLRTELKKFSGLDDTEVNRVLSDVYFNSLVESSFTPTGRKEATAAGNLTFQQEPKLQKLGDMLGIGDKEKAEVVKSIIGEDRYKVATAVHRMIAENEPDPRVKKLELTGKPRPFSVNAFISRFYAIQRGVISPRYVASEALFQQMRESNYNMIHSVLTDPEVGEMFLEMVLTGEPFTPQRATRFYEATLATYAKFLSETGKPEPETMQDIYGREFTFYPDIYKIPETGKDAAVGQGIKIPVFPEVLRRQEDIQRGAGKPFVFSERPTTSLDVQVGELFNNEQGSP